MNKPLTPAEIALRDGARDYHNRPMPGKLSITPTKPLSNQRDLSLAYSPGVAYPCLDIQADPAKAAEYTSRANLVGVITNGTAVLGLGNIGPLAGKPVMEGKACLFKKFAGVDVFDIELAETDPDRLVDIIAALEPTLGGVNLEDIKAPECFYIEKRLRERMNIPVFHDDQHGTAIISSAALLNGLELVGKSIESVKIAVSGAGAAALACLKLMRALGAKISNISVCDSRGLIYQGREGGMDENKAVYAQPDCGARTLADAVRGADVFLGCSTGGVLTAEMVQTMADRPVILALANPEPEIRPEIAREVRPDCIIATGRSDYPNQVNNVLCFPYIFRGALDCGASKITEEMELACVREIAALAKAEPSAEVAAAYAGASLLFGPEYLIPTPFDPRLILRIAPAVAQAAMDSGVATRPIADLDGYVQRLERFTNQTGIVMRPVVDAAHNVPLEHKRVAYAEGENWHVLYATQVVVDDGLAAPILIGRPRVIEERIREMRLRMKIGRDVQCLDPENNPAFERYWQTYHALAGRRGVTLDAAKAAVRHSPAVVAALMVRLGDADAMICGTEGNFDPNLEFVREVIGIAPGAPALAALSAVMLPERTLFIADTYVNENPSAELLAAIASMAAEEVWRFGMPPKVAFVSHSNFGSSRRASALKMRRACELFRQIAPDVECDGEMHGDAALSSTLRAQAVSDSRLQGEANLLICPNLDAANILLNVLKAEAGPGLTIGPMLLGTAAPAHVLTSAAVSRRIINATAIAVAEAGAQRGAAR